MMYRVSRALLLTAAGLLLGLASDAPAFQPPGAAKAPGVTTTAARDLPPEARDTLALIKKKGPFPYTKDGSVFSNREHVLPQKPRGYYREYTVRTPRTKNRGARRIVAGRDGEMYYTDDHYATFKRIQE